MMNKKNTVLIVDDDPATVELLKKMNERLGVADILIANNGFEAIAVAGEKQPGVIFLDVAMPFLDLTTPKLDGIQTLKMLKSLETTKEIDVIMLSEKTDNDNLAMALKYGATSYISKPFQLEILNEKLSRLHSNILSDVLEEVF